jgi:type VI secretion system protein ImpK
MTAIAPTPPVDVPATAPSRQGQLAILLQELLTATVRLRIAPGEAPNDAEAFRAQVLRLISSANQEARRIGYGEQDVGYALYAVVAFLDETVLTMGHPAFRSWQGKPLQEEIFGVNVGGDIFFQYLEALMAREDSPVLSDVLEVFQLCMLLGFRGRYGGANSEILQTWMARVRDRITRIRGTPPPLSPNWAPTGGAVRPKGDPMQRRLLLVFAALLGLSLFLFVLLRLLLSAESSDIGRLVT